MAFTKINKVKAYLRIEHDEEDGLIKDLINAAEAAANDYCRVVFEDMDDIPEVVRHAILLYVSHYYENRENADRESYNAMRAAFENLLYPHRDPARMF
ncbi:MAG: phage gp6-like head-tail connector protein [Clostridiales bacterium]|nr:phage gp6-like head-tail connector protein [Clostridiales bacterium]